MAISIRAAADWVLDQCAAAQLAASTVLDTSVGSVLRAIFEGTSTVATWLQAEVLQLAMMMRLSTATGADVDSWLADWGLTRLPAVPATGTITLSRYTSTGSATVEVGWVVQTGDLTQQYQITADGTNLYWSASVGSSGGYIIPVGTASITVPISAVTAGSAGNVIAGAIDLVGTAMPGVDLVSNATATGGGADAESDVAFKARFLLFIRGLTSGTIPAVQVAIADTQEGLTYSIAENQDEQANFSPGHFVITIDDGSGYPPAALKTVVYAAVDAVRPVGSTFSVQSPNVIPVAVSLTLTLGSGSTKLALTPAIQSAISTYINSLSVGQILSVTRIAQLAYNASPVVTNVSSITLNGAGTDLQPAANAVVKAGAVTIN
ncbi:putative phage protein gp47/JayE [Endobacter medicaginis]|uniref:Baseplate J/gp47 family protein n=1 Tax=Endobacter medicaginis TaxID=1181271 RepID=A0A839V792_9PROT|nr:baseplate J/gp47 family protein [Endobacter medicaginis]MBB3175422.1 putative phage protein gp47/JayE [Endobacter medicaginis]MCX5476871.1 baseplate J/gp47 family protein [Endobacter medicaginis]NVN29608.1 baseplate J/gp47 family protein [Endobacter medicaginis]